MKYQVEITNLNNLINTKKGGKYLLGLLQNLYCSCQSEFSAFLLFNYQHLAIKKKNKKLSNLLKEFSNTCLCNSHTLGELIIKQKGLPFYLNSQHSPLTAFWLNYEVELSSLIKMDKNFLQTLINNYSIYINKIDCKTVKTILEKLQKQSILMLENLKNFEIK